ncbi:MAG: sugar phosphate isomerase/epimerase [Planctomycetes bacterium]|nr:sugar phosphate isomerase/epimerase [Planctomycetota bacterium]
MPIRLGTVGPVGFDDFNPPTWLECMRRLGCRAVQAYRNPAAGLSAGQIKELLASCQMPCDSLHAMYGPDCDPSNPDEQARRRAVENLKDEGRLAIELGGRIVVVHCSDAKPQGAGIQERRQRINRLKKSVEELGRFGQSVGVRYAFENLPPTHPAGSDVAKLAGLLAEVNAPFTGICFDVGHANLSGDPVSAARDAGKNVIYIHLSDNTGSGDEHKMPGHGSIGCKAVIAELIRSGYDGTILLEVFYPERRLNELIAAGFDRKLAELLKRC